MHWTLLKNLHQIVLYIHEFLLGFLVVRHI